MIDYRGPETLKPIVERVFSQLAIPFKRPDPRIEIGLGHMDLTYARLGLESEEAYFARVDSLIEGMEKAKDLAREDSDESLQAWEKYAQLEGEFLNIAISAQVGLNLVDDIDEEGNLVDQVIDVVTAVRKGVRPTGYDPIKDKIVFDPSQVYLGITKGDTFDYALASECVKRDLGEADIYEKMRKDLDAFQHYIALDLWQIPMLLARAATTEPTSHDYAGHSGIMRHIIDRNRYQGAVTSMQVLMNKALRDGKGALYLLEEIGGKGDL